MRRAGKILRPRFLGGIDPNELDCLVAVMEGLSADSGATRVIRRSPDNSIPVVFGNGADCDRRRVDMHRDSSLIRYTASSQPRNIMPNQIWHGTRREKDARIDEGFHLLVPQIPSVGHELKLVQCKGNPLGCVRSK